MIRVNETPSNPPICPHCEKELDALNAKQIKTTFGVRFVYYCDSCSKILGVSHRKGFFMG